MIIDGDHLSRATAGDLALRQDLLILFRDQLANAAPAVEEASGGGAALSTSVLHRLRGSAEAIGAKALARDLARMEALVAASAQDRSDSSAALSRTVHETLDAVEQLIAAPEGHGLAKGGESG